jgi:hypothetical protein
MSKLLDDLKMGLEQGDRFPDGEMARFRAFASD